MNKGNFEDVRIIDIPKITANDGRGNLSVVEKDLIPFDIQRVYYLYDVPTDSTRGAHAHKELQQFLIAISGSLDIVLDNGFETKTFSLNRPYTGLYIPSGYWRVLENFSTHAVCLSLVSAPYDEADYIRDYEQFKLFKGA